MQVTQQVRGLQLYLTFYRDIKRLVSAVQCLPPHTCTRGLGGGAVQGTGEVVAVLILDDSALAPGSLLCVQVCAGTRAAGRVFQHEATS